MWGVMRFHNLLKIGITWKGPEIIELWQSSSDTEKFSTSHEYLTTEGFYYRVPRTITNCIASDEDETEQTTDNEQYSGSGSGEDDSLLVAYDSNSVTSVWRKYKPMATTKSRYFCISANGNLTLLCFIICVIEIYAEAILLLS